MKYLLDSDIVSILYDDSRKNHYELLHSRLANLHDDDLVYTSVLVLCELEYSFHNAPDEKKEPVRNTINAVLNDFDDVLPLALEMAAIFGKLKALLKKARNLNRQEMRKHNVDLMLASTAIQTESILVGTDRIYKELAALHPAFHFQNWLL